MDFKTAYIINLDKRPDRFKSAKEVLNICNIKYERFSGYLVNEEIIDKNYPEWKKSYNKMNLRKSEKFSKYKFGQLGCKMSHYYVIKNAKEKNMPFVTVFEDDIILNEGYKELLNYNLFTNLENNDWDILYLGGKVIGKRYEFVNKYVQRVDSVLELVGYIVNNNFYDTFMKFIIESEYEGDSTICDNSKKQKWRIFICSPKLLYQTWEDSNILER